MCPPYLAVLWGIIWGNFQTTPPISDRVMHTSERCWDVWCVCHLLCPSIQPGELQSWRWKYRFIDTNHQSLPPEGPLVSWLPSGTCMCAVLVIAVMCHTHICQWCNIK